jgi:ssRNA-specific RNase YbeY (16S rRNA maturation enzyme)
MTPAEVPEVEWLLLLSHFLCMATCEKRVSHKQSITEEEWFLLFFHGVLITIEEKEELNS